MGREYRRMTLKVKKNQAEERRRAGAEPQNGIVCQWDQMKIDRATCTVRQTRDTENKCLGCPRYGG